MLNLIRLAVATLLIAGGASSPAAAGGDFWGWGRTYYPPPPVHVYNFRGGPTWTSNGWSYPAVQVLDPSALPPPVYAAPAYGLEHRGHGYHRRPGLWDRRRGW